MNRLLTLNQNRKALKLTKQLHLDFSDYSAKQQEKDAQRSLLRTVFLLKVDGDWGHLFITQRGDDIDFYPGKNLFQTYEALKLEYPRCLPKVIRNEYLEDYLRTKRPEIMKQKHPEWGKPPRATQLNIKWNERD